MEKIIKRSAQAAKTADKRIAKRLKQVQKSQDFMIRGRKRETQAATSNLIIAERKRRKEQWERGALAPRYDISGRANSWGTAPQELVNIPEEHKSKRLEWFHIKEADRVVVLAGRAKGKIAEVVTVDHERCTLQLKGINIDFVVPKHMEALTGGREIVERPLDIPFQNVKLVWAIPDQKTGVPVDVMIDRMEPIGREWDKHKRELGDGQRLISGTDTIIPWPEEIDYDYDKYEADTTVDLVDAVTFTPMLLRAPMPLSVIDELRGKYSRFRSRYDWATKEKITAKADRIEHRKELIKTMRTPLQELAELRAQQKKAREQDLSTEQLAMIGQVMAQELSKPASILRR